KLASQAGSAASAPRSMSTAWPSRSAVMSGHARAAAVPGSPSRASGSEPSVGGSGEPVAGKYGCSSPSISTTEAVTDTLSKEATPMTSSPTPGAPADQVPEAPLLPMEATMTTPASTRLSLATAVGYCGQVENAEPMLWLTTSMPSASARSIAATMMSDSVEPSQPKTR